MRRFVGLGALVACGFAGVFVALALSVPRAAADDGAGGDETATTATQPGDDTVATDETTPTETEPPPPPVTKKRGPKVIVAGVTVGGTLVGGLTPVEARTILTRRFARPVVLVVGPGRRIKVTPKELGAAAEIRKAVNTATGVRRQGFRVSLSVTVPPARLQRWVAQLARRFERDPVDARLRLRKLAPVVVSSTPGRRLNVLLTTRAIRRQLRTHVREPLDLPFREVPAGVRDAEFDDVIVIRRETKKLYLYEHVKAGMKLRRVFGVATGQSSYPTPLGRYEIVVKQRNPWWYPPQGSAWAEGKEPVPPGPGNPLGTRWMGISSPYVGIHGTPDAASIGYSASHGCIRMLIPEVEWLYKRVDVGTTVFIVRA
jgi:lipoprotein-anchoring transpeptidase ErfK/SrfK